MAGVSKIWAEAWTLPGSVSFERVRGPILHKGLTYERKFKDFGSGSFTVGSHYNSHSAIIDPANNVETLIRVFEDGFNVFDFFARSLDKDFEHDGDITISGPGLRDELDKILVYPFDWAASDINPGSSTTGVSRFLDTIYGGENILDNAGFEEGILNEVQAVGHNFTGGTFTLTFDGQTTTALDFDASASDIEDALIALSNVTDVDVSGSGSYDDPWRIEFLDPGQEDLPLMTLNSSMTGDFSPTFAVQEWQIGGDGDPDPWTRSFNPVTGGLHGLYNGFRVGSVIQYGDPAHTGDRAMGIGPLPEANFSGVQQVVSVTPGGIYQAKAWVYVDGGTGEYALVIRDLKENLIAKVIVNITSPNTWTLIEIENVAIFNHIDKVLFRVASVTAGQTASFWVDDCEFNEGLAKTTAGQIIVNLRTTATAEGRDVVPWLDFAFDGVLDSNGNAWVTDQVSLVISAGMSWAQVIELLEEQGYECDLRWDTGTSGYRLYLYNSLGLGTDKSLLAYPKLAPPRIRAAVIRKVTPKANTVLGLGEANIVDEASDLVMEAAYGRREMFINDSEVADLTTLQEVLLHQIDLQDAQKIGVKFDVDSSIRCGPGLDLDLGDTVQTHLPGEMAAEVLRVYGFSTTVNQEMEIVRTLDVGRHILKEAYGGTTSSATSAGLNYLLRKFRKLERLRQSPAPNIVIPEEGVTDEISRPAYFTVPAGGVNPASSSEDIHWELVSDPDGICQPLLAGEEDFIRFNTPGLYLVDYQFHGEWFADVAGWSNWEILSDLWRSGGTVGPWQGDQMYTENSGVGTAYVYVHGTHLIEVQDITTDIYILLYTMFSES